MSLVAQSPTWLPTVEANPKASPYADLIRMATEAGREHWKIWHLFAFRPEITEHLARFTEGVMRAEAPISAGLRELIATYVSYTNQCEFCWRSHAPVAAELLGSDAVVAGVLANVDTAPILEAEKALLRFAQKATRDLPQMAESDVAGLRAHGWDDEAIYFTISVVALFNFYNRWVTVSGVQPASAETHDLHGRRLARSGYEPKNRLAGMTAAVFGRNG